MAVLIFLSFFLISCSPIQYVDYNESSAVATRLIASSDTEFIETKDLFSDSNKHVDKWIQYFSEGSGRQSMQVYLERSGRYEATMKEILKEHDLPEELFYIAMAESGFQSSVVSSKNAVGYWQFIAATGRSYGLTINSVLDERQDFVLVTHAAAKYLKHLYQLYDDWNLAVAAYNAGEGRINQALQGGFYQDYWSLVRDDKIPKETSTFVPKIIAMKKIGTQPWMYGFNNLKYEQPLDYRSIYIYQNFSLKNLSETLQVPHSQILSLNPKYKQDIAPLNGNDKIKVRIPAHIKIEDINK
ncbi:MAG: lytic transglycosylase domain-containing protein [Bdellovibrionales bacterium]